MTYFTYILLGQNRISLTVQSPPSPCLPALPDGITLGMLPNISLCVGNGPWCLEKK